MNPRTLFKFFALVAGLVIFGWGLWLLFSPAQYQAVVKLEIAPDVEIDSDGSTLTPYQPDFMETEVKAVSSDAVLSNVVQSLNLNTAWSKRYARRGQLETRQTVELLRQHMAVEADPDTRLIDIYIWDEYADEAVRIATAVAQAYQDYRIQQNEQQMTAAVEVLRDNFQKEETEISALQDRLDQMRKQLVPTNPAPTDAMVMQIYNAKHTALDPVLKQPGIIKSGQTDVVRVAMLDRLKEQVAATNTHSADAEQMDRYDAYFQAKREMDTKEQSHELLKTRIQLNQKEEAKLDRAGALDRLARIAEPAVSKSTNARKHRRGIVWLICGLVISRGGYRSLVSDRRAVVLQPKGVLK